MTFVAFLTAYDPTDLPATSLDPLGFDRSYNALAEAILPGLTLNASRPRYLSLLCAALSMAEAGRPSARVAAIAAREDAILRLERLWALGCVLVERGEGRTPAGARNAGGLRGVTYARAAADRAGAGAKVSGEFLLLSRQRPYGAIGIYANVAERLRLLDRDGLVLTPDLGERLAEAFRAETRLPASIVEAVRAPKPVPVPRDDLIRWADRAFVEGPSGMGEAALLLSALRRDPVRDRMAGLLAEHPLREDEGELARLNRLREAARHRHPDLAFHLQSILAYEACFRAATLVLDRLLSLCVAHGALAIATLNRDEVLSAARDRLPVLVSDLRRHLDQEGAPAGARGYAPALSPIRQFLEGAAAACADNEAMAIAVLDHHAAVQRGKFDNGRPKAPWIERRDNTLSLTFTGVPILDAANVDEMRSHEYRTATVDAFLRLETGR